MGVSDALLKRTNLLSTIGKTGLNIAFPNEFELYLCALELTDQSGKTLKYFVFPIMPSGIDEGLPQLTNIKKTAAGVTVLSSPTFNPTDITLSGNFGRSFKIVLGSTIQDFISSFTADGTNVDGNSLLAGAASFFSNDVKTGYGCIKVLQDIVEQSQQVDGKGIRRLIFYNPALGNSYLVKAINLRFNQSQESNMIWNYTLQLKSIAPLEALYTKKELQQREFTLAATGFAQREVNNLVNGLANVLAK